MPWDRNEQARGLSSLPADALIRLLLASEVEATETASEAVGMIVRLLDEAASRIAHGGVLRLAAAGPLAHLAHFATEETRAWFPDVIPIEALTADRDASEEDAVAVVDSTVSPEDVVLGLSRTGARPWTCTVMRKANMVGALTASITCVPDSPVSRESDMPIVLRSGAEVVMGCTQYGATNALKATLDALLLALAVQAGGVVGDVPVRAHVGGDAWRLVAAAAQVDHLRARSLLAAAEGDVTVAIVMARLGVDADEARRRLTGAKGRIEKIPGLG